MTERPLPGGPRVSGLRAVLRSRLAGDTAVLYAVHVLGLLVPLVTVPYLARVLRPTGWGLVVFAQSLGAWLAMITEYGFNLSGTRSVSRGLDRPEELTGVVAGVQGAKLVVVAALQPAVVGLYFLVPAFRAQPALLVWAWAFAVAKGLSPAWYFFGVHRLRGAAALDAGARVLAALGVFVLVQGPDDGWRVLALQAVFMGGAVAWMTTWMYREVEPARPTLAASLHWLRTGWGIFVFRGASGLFYQANAFIVGLLGSPQTVAFFGGSEKVIRAGIGLYHPLNQAVFPRMSRLSTTDPDRAGHLLKVGLRLFGGLGVALAVVTVLFAPQLVRVLLGPGYEQAVPVLRILAVLPVLIALGTVLGIHWALPAGLERPFYRLVIAAGLLNVAAAVVLVPRLEAVGMAAAVVMAEILVTVGLFVVFRSKGGSLWPMVLPEIDRARSSEKTGTPT